MVTIPLNAIGSPAFLASSFFSIHCILYTHFQSGSARVDTGIENGNGYARSIVLRMLLEEASSTSLRFRKQRVHRKLNRPDIHDLTKLYYNNINRFQGTCITSPRGGTWAGTICMRPTHFGFSHVRVDLWNSSGLFRRILIILFQIYLMSVSDFFQNNLQIYKKITPLLIALRGEIPVSVLSRNLVCTSTK